MSLSHHSAIRTCIGCKERDEVSRLVRFGLHPSTRALALLPRTASRGRGASLHPSTQCISAATRMRAFKKAFRCEVQVLPEEVRALVQISLEKRLKGLISAAQGKRACLPGTAVSEEALRQGQAYLMLVAKDCSARERWIQAAEHKGVAIIEVESKAALGELLERRNTGVVALTDAQLAEEMTTVLKTRKQLLEVA